MAFPVGAQEAQSHELLYRLGDYLYLTNVDTGTTITLPNISASMSDSWVWSPDGRYLLGNFSHSKTEEKLLRIYDVDIQCWIRDIHVDNYSGYGFWSSDSTQIAYTQLIQDDHFHRSGLWVFNLKTATQSMSYQTDNATGNLITDTGIGGIWWSPDNQYLLFEEYYNSMATLGTHLNLISVDGKLFKRINTLGGTPFFPADPIWSSDSKWFLLQLRDTFDSPYDPDDRSDVFLYGIEDQIYQLTRTQNVPERNLQWSLDGKKILFDTDDESVIIDLTDILDHPHTPQSFTRDALPLLSSSVPHGNLDYPSGDGEYVAHTAYSANNLYDLYITKYDGSQVQIAKSIIFLGWRPS